MQLPYEALPTAGTALREHIIDCAARFVETMRNEDAQACDSADALRTRMGKNPEYNFSEPETEILRAAAQSHADELKRQLARKPNPETAVGFGNALVLLEAVQAPQLQLA